MRTLKRVTIERTAFYHLYYCDGDYFVNYYGGKIAHGYQTEAAAREAIYYHFN